MFIVPKYIMQGLGMLLGYFYNILIIVVLIAYAVKSLNERDFVSSLVVLGLALLLSYWTFSLVKKKMKTNK